MQQDVFKTQNSPWQLPCDCQKNFIDVVRVLGGRLHEQEPVLFRVPVGLFEFNRSSVRQVRLVPGQRNHNVRSGKEKKVALNQGFVALTIF